MGNVNMEADQIHVRDNSHKTWRTVADALKALEASGEGVVEDITELYTRDASRASKDDIANEFDAETLYHTGDYAYYEGTLFKFTANHSGEWDPADVVIAQIGDDLVELKSGFTNLDNEVNGDATVYPYADVITIEDAVPANLADCSVKIEPVQDLHGYDKPWVGGAGKNKLPISVQLPTTIQGVTWTKNNDGSISAIRATSSSNNSDLAYNTSSIILPAGSYVFSSNAQGEGGGSSFQSNIVYDGESHWGTGERSFTLSEDGEISVILRYYSSYSGSATFYPMIRLATETDATFAPYTNICPITGHTEASVTVADDAENPTVTKTYIIALGDTIYGGTVDFDSGVMTVTMAQIASYDGETIGEPWISDRDVYAEGVTPTTGSQVVYTLATPTTIQLTPKQIQLLKGRNTLTASTGQISVTVNGVAGAIGSVQEQVNATDAALAEVAEKLPDAPTTDGTYTLTVTVADGTPTYSWGSGS